MPRTYSLAALTLLLLTSSLVLGVWVNFPELLLITALGLMVFALLAAFIAPAAAAWSLLSRLPGGNLLMAALACTAAASAALSDQAAMFLAIPTLSALLFGVTLAIKRSFECQTHGERISQASALSDQRSESAGLFPH
jgi:hypothetical protein